MWGKDAWLQVFMGGVWLELCLADLSWSDILKSLEHNDKEFVFDFVVIGYRLSCTQRPGR